MRCLSLAAVPDMRGSASAVRLAVPRGASKGILRVTDPAVGNAAASVAAHVELELCIMA